MITRILATTCVIWSLAGCGTAVGQLSPTILDRALATPDKANGVLAITRDLALIGFQCNHLLELDGKPFAELRRGEQVTIYPPPGQHRLVVRLPNVTCNSEAELMVTIDQGQRLAFRTAGQKNGEVALVRSKD